MTCASCQAPLDAGVAFCSSCGTAVSAAAPAAARPAAAPMRTYSIGNTITPMRERTGGTLEAGAIFAHRYEVLTLIGEGGMGVVYLTRDMQSGDEVVLKLLHPTLVGGEQAMTRLVKEGLTARKITHKNIVRVHDVGQWEGQPYLTMEHVPGGTLRTWMTTVFHARQLVPFETAVGIVRALAAGLSEAHRMKFIHRDLKPENVLLASDLADGTFNLKILDFGIARAVDAPRSASRGPEGTPFYMAPEQLTAGDSAGPDADIYSLSAMFYELLVKVVPRGGLEKVARIRTDVPDAIDGLFEKGLAQSPLGRFQSVDDFMTALEAVVEAGREGQRREAREREAREAAARGQEAQAAAEAARQQAEVERRRRDAEEQANRKRDDSQRLIDGRQPRSGGWWANLSMTAKAGVIVGTLALMGAANNWYEQQQAATAAAEQQRQWDAAQQREREAAAQAAGEAATRAEAARLAAERQPVRPTTPAAPDAFPDLGGVWVDSSGQEFQVTMRGRTFKGAAMNGVVLDGSFNANWSGSFALRDQFNNVLFQTGDARLRDTGTGYHIDYAGGGRTFFVNHPPH